MEKSGRYKNRPHHHNAYPEQGLKTVVRNKPDKIRDIPEGHGKGKEAEYPVNAPFTVNYEDIHCKAKAQYSINKSAQREIKTHCFSYGDINTRQYLFLINNC